MIILLTMPFAFAGQVSDFFSYFTNDAFSLITGAPAFNPIGNDFGANNFADGLARNAEGTNNPPATGNKANGAACTAHSQCTSKVCTKITNTKSICGKKKGDPCTVPKKAECFSNSCVSGKCGLSPLGKSCIKTADCVQGQRLICKNNKCTKPATVVPTTPVVQTTQVTETSAPASESNAEEDTLKEEAVNSIDQLKNKADALLNVHATTPTGNLVNANVVNLRQYSLLSRITGNFMFQTLITGAAPAPTGNKANGAICTAASASQCRSKVCTKISGQNGICGKKTGDQCQAAAKSYCLSNICSNSRCGLSQINGLCSKSADCSTGNCNVNTHKCAARRAAKSEINARCTKDDDCTSGYCNNANPRKCAARFQTGLLARTEIVQNNLANDAACTRNTQCASGYCSPTVPRKCAVKPSALKANGVLCKKSNECNSGLCLCSTQAKGACQVSEESETQVDGGASNTPQIDFNMPGVQGFPIVDVPKYCTRNEECSEGVCVCQTGKGKCVAFTAYAPRAPAAPTTPVVETTITPVVETTVLTTETTSTTSAAPIEETPVVEAQFDVSLAQSTLDGLYVQMNALRQKVIQEASNHNEIDLGSIGCRSPA